MNSDPHENAAWRSFGLMDSDAAAAFDEATRNDCALSQACREIDHLAAAIAVNSATRVTPRQGQLERLHLRLGLSPSRHRNWLAISGWASAACLAGLLALDRFSKPFASLTKNPSSQHSPLIQPENSLTEMDGSAVINHPGTSNDSPPRENLSTLDQNYEGKAFVKIETKRLIQEIEILRDKLENFQKQDRKRFEPIPGLAWPVVMRMGPPETSEKIANRAIGEAEEPPIVALLGDALASAEVSIPRAEANLARANEFAQVKLEASAIPIYDAARDTGTLVVSNLPTKTADERFNLWVVTQEGGNPVYVGRLPDSVNQGTESFDFSLGSTAVVPTGFLLTKDVAADPTMPSKASTILLGPK